MKQKMFASLNKSRELSSGVLKLAPASKIGKFAICFKTDVKLASNITKGMSRNIGRSIMQCYKVIKQNVKTGIEAA